MGTETWIISLPLSDSILYLKIIHPPNFREEPFFVRFCAVIFGWRIYLWYREGLKDASRCWK